MWKSFKALFESALGPSQPAHGLELAGLALLLEIARADHNSDERELTAIVQAGVRVFGLQDSEAQALLAAATHAVEESVSLFEFTQEINARFDPTAKRKFLEQLWRVAYADGALDHYEEYYLRKIADLLHIGQRDFIQAKLAVSG